MAEAAPESETCWTVVRRASRGEGPAREAFVRTYWPVVHDFLAARWKGSRLRDELDDAMQEVFLDCFRADGALGRVERERDLRFRQFLYGVVRNVALRAEKKAYGAQRPVESPEDLAAEESALQGESPSRLFDRSWARSIVQAAADRLESEARQRGETALRRVELLRLRFHEGLPIRAIAERWSVDAAVLHHDFARARKEFESALKAEVAFHLPGSVEEVERECARMLDLLG